MKTSKEFRAVTASIKMLMSGFYVASFRFEISRLDSELGRTRANNVLELIGSNLRERKYSTREQMLVLKMQPKKLRIALSRQRYRNLGREPIQHLECNF